MTDKLFGRSIYGLIDALIDYHKFLKEITQTDEFLEEYQNVKNEDMEHIDIVFICAYARGDEDAPSPSTKYIIENCVGISADISHNLSYIECVKDGLRALTKKHNLTFLANDRDPLKLVLDRTSIFSGPIAKSWTPDDQDYVDAIALHVNAKCEIVSLDIYEGLIDKCSSEFLEFCLERGIPIDANNFMKEEVQNV